MKKLILLLCLCSLYTFSFAQEFAVKGFHIDLRIQVMKMPALKAFAKHLSENGINTIVMEWEGSYPFADAPLIPNRYAYTRTEIADFIAYCNGLHIDVIPLQQSFGHVEYILRNYQYAALREDPKDFSQVCPSQVALNKELFTKLFKDLASTHSSPFIHIGCDETHLLGHCPICSKRADSVGVSKIYFDHVKMLCDIVVSLGKRPVLWADIALKYPQYLKLLPKQTVLIDWNYGWPLDNFGNHATLVNSGFEVWGAPAIRSDPDNYGLTKWEHHFSNINSFIPICRQLGYKGIIMTSWSTSGEYDARFDAGGELKDLYAVRHVYPISGFGLLIDAFLQAIKQQQALKVDSFIQHYCQEQYGLTAKAAVQMQEALFKAPYAVINGEVKGPGKLTVKQLLDSAQQSATILHALHPLKGITAFQHYLLMADIRVYYLRYINIEAAVNNGGDIHIAASQLKALMALEPALNKTFEQLNSAVLYPSEIENENTVRCYRTHQLYERLSRIK
jgi:hexosaminidase